MSKRRARGAIVDDSDSDADSHADSVEEVSSDDVPIARAAKRVQKVRSGTSGAGGRVTATAGAAAAAAAAGLASVVEAGVDGELDLRKVRQLRDAMKSEKTVRSLADVPGLDAKTFMEVLELENEELLERIEKLVAQLIQNITDGSGLSFALPVRSAGNITYVPELDRIVLKDKMTTREFANTSSVRKATIMARILNIVHSLAISGIHVTKRDLFYTDVKLFQAQERSDEVLDDVACMLGCTRTSLNVVASEKGVVVGRLKFRDSGDFIDCTKMGTGGKAIPPFIDKVTDIESDAEFILLVEKDAAFMRLAEDRFYNKYPCIIITAKGQPDVATRLFLRRVKDQLRIPVLGLVDSDPYGLKILSVYMSGSKNMSYDSASLTTSDIKWLGVRPSDLDRYHIPEDCRLDMTAADLKTARELLKEDFIQKNPKWVKELELMESRKKKAEIQALSNRGFQFLTQVYLPQKIAAGDWI